MTTIVQNKTGQPVAQKEAAMKYSTTQVKRKVLFKLTAPAGSAVSVAGTFNKWDPKANPMKATAAQPGAFSATVPLLPGKYEYKFVVNGDWQVDPACRESVDNKLGSRNSVIVI
jgi:1,4-alpha-glucan branching enzyme